VVLNIEQVDIQPGDLLLVYTDGVTDALSPAREAFGVGRLADLVQEPFTTAGGLLERIRVELSLHSDGIEQFDDITLLAVQWLARA
jgi:sigma-B regulation protein RsbU (phosphoserine phosphatase)